MDTRAERLELPLRHTLLSETSCLDAMPQRRSGVPIGAPFSSAILEAVLAFHEDRYDRVHPNRRRQVATGRYADDVIFVSRCLCGECLLLLLQTVCAGSVVFDPECSWKVVGSYVMRPFLDMATWATFAEMTMCVLTFKTYSLHSRVVGSTW